MTGPAPDGVDLWRIDAAGAAVSAEILSAALDASETARAARLLREEDRHRFLLFRFALREILGRYLRLVPGQVGLQTEARGKPVLVAGDLCFNLAHAGAFGLLAIARDAVGIDIEGAQAPDRWAGLAARILGPAEARALAALRPTAQPGAFMRIWTRKEAYVKATGEGMALPLTAVAVSSGQPARLLAVDGRPGETGRWFLHHLEPWPETVGALVTRHPDPQFAWYDWTGAAAP